MKKITALSLLCPLMLASAAMAAPVAKKGNGLKISKQKNATYSVTDGDTGQVFSATPYQVVPNLFCDRVILDSKGRGLQVLKGQSGSVCSAISKEEDGTTAKPVNVRLGGAMGTDSKSLSKPALACLKNQTTNFSLASRQNSDYAKAARKRVLNNIVVYDNSGKKVSDSEMKANEIVGGLVSRRHCEDLPTLAKDLRCRDGGGMLDDKEIEFVDSVIVVSSKGECDIVSVADYEKIFKELADHDAQLAKAQVEEKPAIDPNQAVKDLMGDAGTSAQTPTVDGDASAPAKAVDAHDGGAPADAGAPIDAGSVAF